ncbi:acid phosphatase Vanadium-dependent haloperoxidase [Micractinium conductrix]|uniref:Acid phosphatase Vanadium-dependent haloperoxidase n=1 Tax=Micractinium conductrix TaxID=554055 RepID=A0A2P6VPN2_9CHLO|nr:acid phosphatase Vanadium-dependent haloperoxidase [Micractinium conductrix]|eukprot:PSC76017.1 acid phosphatase Vanadium-dependent haloperoxidase [Micractinium conductrix]
MPRSLAPPCSSTLSCLAQYKALQGLPVDADEALQEAAAAFAGHTVLSALFPWRFSKLDKAIKPLVADLDAAQKAEAKEVGREAAVEVVKASLDDGFAAYEPFAPAEEGADPDEYQFAPNQTYVVYPQIATSSPLVLDSVEEFKPAPPLRLGSDEYVAQLQEVYELGRKGSASRTREQTDTIAQVLIADRNLTVREAAQLFALLNAATWDASIAAYTEKYAQPSWRPITAIRVTQEAVDEVNWSRVYGGVHFRHAVTEGAKLGAAVAQAVIEAFEDKFGPALESGVHAAAAHSKWTRQLPAESFTTCCSETAAAPPQ